MPFTKDTKENPMTENENKAQATEHSKKHLKEILESFDAAMMVTSGNGGKVHSRPMMIAARDGESVLWFSTSKSSLKAKELQADPEMSLALQSARAFVSLVGHAELVDDRARIDQLWNESWKVWFPKGKEDPDLALIRFTAREAEYWDIQGAKGIRYLFEAAKAYLQGERPDAVDGAHGTVRT
ncbi:pyridoxamine 5'-phosphate oxidase family protein [soil metagenome]